MTVSSPEPIINYWYRALHSPLGVCLICSDAAAVRAKLYVARKEAKDLDLDQISVCLSPFDPQRLWLVKKAKDEKA